MKNQLEAARTLKGLTQQELADMVNVSRQTIISLERERYNPSIVLAFKLARIFEMPVEQLFQYSEEDNHHE